MPKNLQDIERLCIFVVLKEMEMMNVEQIDLVATVIQHNENEKDH
jgi:hypothetical protein